MSDQETHSHAPVPAVPLQPIPTHVSVGEATLGSGDAKAVVLSISTPLGIQHYFFDDQQASMLAKHIQKQARDINIWAHTSKPKLFVPGKEV